MARARSRLAARSDSGLLTVVACSSWRQIRLAADGAEVGTANGLVGMAGWTGGLLFSLAIGQLADTIGYAPLFATLGVFDLLAAVVLIAGTRSLEKTR